MGLEDVKSHGICFVRRIEEHDIAESPLGNSAENLVDQIAVRIEYGESFSSFNVLKYEVEEQG